MAASLPSRVFMNGNSQAVRIPAEFRLSTDQVQISRTPEGDLIIHPCPPKCVFSPGHSVARNSPSC